MLDKSLKLKGQKKFLYSKTFTRKNTGTPVFIAALFMMAKTRRHATCPLTGDWTGRMWSIRTMEHYSAIRKDEMLLFATTWMDLENIMLSKISLVRKREEPYGFTHVWDVKLKLIDTDNSMVVTRGKGVVGEGGKGPNIW